MTAVFIVAVPGVQRFIATGRKTRDVWAASDIVQQVSAAVAQQVASTDGARLVIPVDPASRSIPNRVVGVCGDLATATAAAAAAGAAGERRRAELMSTRDRASAARLPIVWVAAEGDAYPEAWERAQAALVRRRRIGDFPALLERSAPGDGAAVCSTCGLQRSRVTRDSDLLCSVCAAKRAHRLDADGAERFPSTSDVASAFYRVAARERAPRALEGVVEAVQGFAALGVAAPGLHRAAVPGFERAVGGPPELSGQWLYPQAWDPEVAVRSLGVEAGLGGEWETTCEVGRRAAENLAEELAGFGVSSTPYFAIVVQDGDHLGGWLSEGEVSEERHRAIAGALSAAAVEQMSIVESPDNLGRVVYAGGDDVLAFVPLEAAFRVARKSVAAFAGALAELLPEVTASVGLAVVHRSTPLQDAMAVAGEALHTAKRSGRDRLCVVAVRRGGERARMVVRTSEIENVEHVFRGMLDRREGDLARRFPSKVRMALAEAMSTIPPSSTQGLPPGFVSTEVRRLLDRSEGDDALSASVESLVVSSVDETCGRFDTIRVLAVECS